PGAHDDARAPARRGERVDERLPAAVEVLDAARERELELGERRARALSLGVRRVRREAEERGEELAHARVPDVVGEEARDAHARERRRLELPERAEQTRGLELRRDAEEPGREERHEPAR